MIRALLLLLSPGGTWLKIATAKRNLLWVFCLELVPILAVTCALEGYLLMHWGEKAGQYDRVVRHTQQGALGLAAAHFLIGMAMVFVAGHILRWVGESFHFYPSYQACFTLSAYGLTPYFLLRLVHYAPGFGEWLGPVAGVVACAFVLYQGVGVVLEPQQSQGFGLYVLSVLVFAFLCGIDQLLLKILLENRAFA